MKFNLESLSSNAKELAKKAMLGVAILTVGSSAQGKNNEQSRDLDKNNSKTEVKTATLENNKNATKTINYADVQLDKENEQKKLKDFDTAPEVQWLAEHDAQTFFIHINDFKKIEGLDLAAEIVKTAEKNPGFFLDHATDLKDISGLNLAEEIIKAAEKEPIHFVFCSQNFEDIAGIDEYSLRFKAAEKAPVLYLAYPEYYKEFEGSKLAADIKKSASQYPIDFFINLQTIKEASVNEIDLAGCVEAAATENPTAFLSNLEITPDIFSGITGLDLNELKKKCLELAK
ncbi:MAG: hypothetical protein ACOYL8_01665 [Patescibacteria group bacterium]